VYSCRNSSSMSKSYNVDIAEFPDYLAPHDSFAIFTPTHTPLSASFPDGERVA
jgi:hypothetical protein